MTAPWVPWSPWGLGACVNSSRTPSREAAAGGRHCQRWPQRSPASPRLWIAWCLLHRFLQGLVQIVDEIVRVLDPDGKAHQILRDAGLQLLLGRQLLVRGRRRMD